MVWLRQMHLDYCLLLIRIVFMPQRRGLFGAHLWQQVRGFSERWGFGGLPVLDPFLKSHCWSSLAQFGKTCKCKRATFTCLFLFGTAYS